jgi:hypothetical protein
MSQNAEKNPVESTSVCKDTCQAPVQSPTQWTPFLSGLEAEGQWAEIVERSVPWVHEFKGWAELPNRWKAGLARAYVFLGKEQHAQEILQYLDSKMEDLSSETQAVKLLAESALERRHERWAQAIVLAQKAKALAISCGNLHLEADARFGEALALAEEGEHYLAITILQSLRNEARSMSPYRRGLAALNEAWYLWDTGQWELVRDVLSTIPRNDRPKIEVYLAAFEHRVSELRQMIVHGFADVDAIHATDLEQIVLILSEWQSIAPLGDRVLNVYDTWLYRTLCRMIQDTQSEVTLYKLKLCRSLILDGTEPRPEERPVDVPWRSEIELRFIEFLEGLTKWPHLAMEFFEENLEPLLKEHRIKTPLIPRLHEFSFPSNPWAKRISERLLRQTESNGAKPVSSTLELVFEDHALTDPDQGVQVDFKKSPVSEKLIRILAGRRGRTLSKADLHFALTHTAYKQELHDDRLHKLLKRTASKIEESLGVDPWSLPGNNKIRLEIDLVVR